MKPICSIKGEWCIEPARVYQSASNKNSVIVECADYVYAFKRPYDTTFEQFMRDYASCTAPIYFVEEE